MKLWEDPYEDQWCNCNHCVHCRARKYALKVVDQVLTWVAR